MRLLQLKRTVLKNLDDCVVIMPILVSVGSIHRHLLKLEIPLSCLGRKRLFFRWCSPVHWYGLHEHYQAGFTFMTHEMVLRVKENTEISTSWLALVHIGLEGNALQQIIVKLLIWFKNGERTTSKLCTRFLAFHCGKNYSSHHHNIFYCR